LFRRTTALRALIVGYADNSHTCAVSSVFCLGRAKSKNGFQKLASRAIIDFFDKLKRPEKGAFFVLL
ncbi:MAG: hypothetical protein EGR45_01545, partial [Ruminococcaceae bacterium]|nr:hypothetical protein [Oscillospiraceae bacterium]